MVQPQVTVGFISATADDTQYIRGGHSLVRYPGGSVEAPTFILSLTEEEGGTGFPPYTFPTRMVWLREVQ